jgi:flagellar biosynthesis/type III secretory pathway protein FliH
MSSRRLKIVKRCSVCAQNFRPFKSHQLCCSHTCGAIRRVRMYPHHHQMNAANRVRREQLDAALQEQLRELSPVEIYKKGHKRGYFSGYQKGTREMRKWA